MIGKITTGKGAGGTVAYVTEKDGAQLLSSTWTGPAETWASQAHEHGHALNPSLTDHGQSVVHISLNAAPGERLSDDEWRAVSEEYLGRMGWEGHDHAVVRHTDTDHDHVHIIMSRVGHDGQTADLHHDFPRQERVLDSIERDFGLERTHEQIRIEAEKDPFRAVESATRSHLTFERADVDRYFERLGFETDKVKQLTDSAMRDDRVLFASSAGVTDKFTTREVVAEVQKLDAALHQLASQEARPTLDRGAGAREGLDAGQRAAADRIAAGGGLTVVEGLAGAGKSTMLLQANEDLKFSGHDVVGVAPSGKAAKGLEQSAGIESNTLTKTLMQIESGERKLTANTVVVMDEAGMARNDELGKLAQHVADAGGRLVLVGDEKQLGAVGRGGGFAEAREIAQGNTARLDEIHRQKEDWQRDASKAFGEGRARDALQSYIDHGRVEWAASRGTARNMLVSDYVKELERGTSPEKMLALAHENRDVKAMNAEIRDAIKERGGLKDERTYKLESAEGKTQKIGVAVGDRVVFERNSVKTGEKNGEFGTVTKTDRRGFDVRMDDGRQQRVEDGGKHQMSHGYASTIHKSQGSTIGKVFALASKGMDAALSYVGLSRHREDVKLYANHTEFKDADHLKNSLSRDGGREAFKSVLSAGDGIERAQSAQKDRDHGQAGPAEEQRETQQQKGQAQSARQKQEKQAQKSQDHGQQAGGREKSQAKDAGHGPGKGQAQEKQASTDKHHAAAAPAKDGAQAGNARSSGPAKAAGARAGQGKGKDQAKEAVAGKATGKTERSKSKGYGL